MSIVFEVDRKYGGFYVYRTKTSNRICLGYIAITYHPFSIYDRLHEVSDSKGEK